MERSALTRSARVACELEVAEDGGERHPARVQRLEAHLDFRGPGLEIERVKFRPLPALLPVRDGDEAAPALEPDADGLREIVLCLETRHAREPAAFGVVVGEVGFVGLRGEADAKVKVVTRREKQFGAASIRARRWHNGRFKREVAFDLCEHARRGHPLLDVIVGTIRRDVDRERAVFHCEKSAPVGFSSAPQSPSFVPVAVGSPSGCTAIGSVSATDFGTSVKSVKRVFSGRVTSLIASKPARTLRGHPSSTCAGDSTQRPPF